MFDLFEAPLPINDAPVDPTEINQVLLYYSNEEVLEFKRLVKKGIPDLIPDYKTKGNQSDFILLLLKKVYGENNL